MPISTMQQAYMYKLCIPISVELRCNIWGELSKAHIDHFIMFATHMFIYGQCPYCRYILLQIEYKFNNDLKITTDLSTEALKREY